MHNTNEILRRHLSNAIYIENSFGLELFKKEVEQPKSISISPAIRSRVSKQDAPVNANNIEEKAISVEEFFKASQSFSNKINILPYLFQPEILDEKLEDFIKKLSNFPLIIIDWQLEEGLHSKNGLDVFEKIIDNNDVLHYYVIYSKELSTAVKAFKRKYRPEIGEIAQDKIAVINSNAIVLFCDKVTHSIDYIIDRLCKFTEDNYGFLPQLFLSVKHQIEDRTAILYNHFMGLDSMMLPQLINDEVYNYEGLQEEVLISVIFNQLRNSIKIESDGNFYLKSVVGKLIGKKFKKDDFNRAKTILNSSSKGMTFENFNERLQAITDMQCLKSVDYEGLKNASQLFFDGKILEGNNKKTQNKIKDFILFLSLCSDEKYYEKYIKLLSLIKLTYYNPEQQWTFKDCLNGGKIRGVCQGDVFIDDTDTFLLCITPSCQLMRPDKIKSTYTFLKGNFADEEGDYKQKQNYSMHLVNKDKTKVCLIKWEFYSPVVLDFSEAKNLIKYKKYRRYYKLNMEYTHRIIELYSEFIKLIGVEDVFGKSYKTAFVELKK